LHSSHDRGSSIILKCQPSDPAPLAVPEPFGTSGARQIQPQIMSQFVRFHDVDTSQKFVITSGLLAN
jgi:hypothetical protein